MNRTTGNLCRCGHQRSEHDVDGRCKLFAEAEPPKGDGNCWRQPTGTCYCQEFDNTRWSWVVWQALKPPPGNTGCFSTAECEITGYTVRQKNNPKEHGPYKTKSRAQQKADELNRLDVLGLIDPEYADRRKRLKRFAPGFNKYAYHDGEGDAHFPLRPERYLIDGFDDGWHGEEWHQLADTIAEVREALESDQGHEVMRVIDLDTGEELSYDRKVSVTVG